MADDGLFESFYTHFVLRDFIGKIVPGALVVVAFCLTVPSFPDFVRSDTRAQTPNVMETIRNVPFIMWLFLAGASWLVGIAVQFFAESVFQKTDRSPTAIKSRAERKRKFLKHASPDERRVAERSDIILEGGRNVSMAMLLALVVASLARVCGYISAQWPNYAILVIGWVGMIVVLWRMFRYHRDFRKAFEESVVAHAEKASNDKPTSTEKDGRPRA